jgi:hypothetical protein
LREQFFAITDNQGEKKERAMTEKGKISLGDGMTRLSCKDSVTRDPSYNGYSYCYMKKESP